MSQSIHANGIDIGFTIDGDLSPAKPWLVFAHSLACDRSMWEPQVEVFKRPCNLLRYDLRGHGTTSAPAGDYTLEMLADDLKGLLEALRIQRCHFVGLSLGGMVGQLAALRMPMRFASLTLANTTSRHPLDARAIWEQRIAAVRGPTGMNAVVTSTLERWFTPEFRAQRPDMVHRIATLVRNTPINGYVGCAQAIARLNLTARLEGIRCPVLVIVGEEDRGTSPAMGEEIVQSIPGARLERIPNAAHLSNLEQPVAFSMALRGFLAVE
ncbi:MAG: alpha/beta fold hydrolase [Betaproteobacteria bacterium]